MEYTARTIFKHILENYNEILGNYYPLYQGDIDNILKINEGIDRTKLCINYYNGLHHSQKVMMFAYILGKKENLNEEDMKILLDAAMYHDIGKINDIEDSFHGYSSSLKLENKLTDDFYKDSNNLKILLAVINAHSRTEKEIQLAFDDYEIDNREYERYKTILTILKDANFLDRLRDPKSTSSFIKEKYLKLESSKKLINLALDVNVIFRHYIDELNYNKYLRKYSNSQKNNVCFHGIGWDFVKLESILDSGLVSQYVANKNNFTLSRNYNGNNSNMWISVVDSKDIAKDGECLKLFIDGNITLVSFVGDYCLGVDKKNTPEARDNGLPINSGLYNDECFVFGQIPGEDIYAIILPKDSLNKEIKLLNFLNCSNNYEIIENRTLNYVNYLNKFYNVEIDLTNFYKLLNSLKNSEIEFSKLDDNNQKKIKDEFFETTNILVSKINELIQSWMNGILKLYFNVDRDILVSDLIIDIFNRHNIDCQKLDGEEIIYCINKQKIK